MNKHIIDECRKDILENLERIAEEYIKERLSYLYSEDLDKREMALFSIKSFLKDAKKEHETLIKIEARVYKEI